MKTTIATAMIGMILAGSCALGQGLGFNVALSHSQVKESNLNGLVHRGPGFSVAGVYEHLSQKSRQRLELNAGIHLLKSKLEPETGSYLIQSSLSYRYDRSIPSSRSGLEFFLGGSTGLKALQGIYENWDENHFYWLTSYSMGIHGMSVLRVGRHGSLSLEADLPLIALLSRTPSVLFHHEDNPDFSYVFDRIHRDPAFEGLQGHFAPEFKLAFHTALREGTRQTLFWKITHVKNHMEASDQLLTVQHAFGIEFLF